MQVKLPAKGGEVKKKTTTQGRWINPWGLLEIKCPLSDPVSELKYL